MALYLVQHGKSNPKDQDPQQGLSEQGQAETLRIAKVAADYGVSVGRILHSGKQRALQTAEIMADQLEPANGVAVRQGMKPLDDVRQLAGTVKSGDHMMLVGHLPFMERLAAYLVTGSTEQRIFKFQNGGIVCLDTDQGPDDWVIRWALMPNIGETS
jgi:phosphohistidine phosphatase